MGGLTMNKAILLGAAAGCVLALAASVLSAGQARAAVSVYATDQSRDCYIAAKFGDKDRHGIDDCTRALMDVSGKHDIAGMLVNRGVIYLSYQRYALALQDFNDAIKTDPSIGEAYANRGACQIAERRFAEGKADIDQGLTLGTDEPQKAYYNRGLAEDYLGDEKAAYFDYLKASELDPEWYAPKKELLRFSVNAGAPHTQ
jgi:tetratricopeptide (TPR) repeat protein